MGNIHLNIFLILDGDNLQHGELVTSLRPDTYVVHPSKTCNWIVIITDVDSIYLVVKKGDTFDFADLLNNCVTCFQ